MPAKSRLQPTPTEDRKTGKVARLITDRGFGWIRGDDDGVDYFFHYTELQGGRDFKQLLVGALVTFQPTYPPKGPRANQVEVGTDAHGMRDVEEA